jgi:hypothetical protein
MLEEGPEGPVDAKLLAFMDAMRAAFPLAFPSDDSVDAGWQPKVTDVVFELNPEPGCMFLGIPFSFVPRVASAAQIAAAEHDLVILDPQAEAIYLPPRFGGSAVDWGAGPTDEELLRWQAELQTPLPPDQISPDITGDPTTDMVAMLREMAGGGVEMWSPMGYQITPEMTADIFDDPMRTPSSIQIAEHKTRLLADLDSRKRSERRHAVTQLAGWDPDADVEVALRSLLASDDEMTRWLAASGLARQGATDALDDVLEVVRLASPAEGGSIGSMLMPLQAALDLARATSPEAIGRARSLAREWRGDQPARPKEWDREFEEMLGSD